MSKAKNKKNSELLQVFCLSKVLAFKKDEVKLLKLQDQVVELKKKGRWGSAKHVQP